MADFATIWKYVERELKVPIPPYIKNVLKCCGFDNCYTIASIEEGDLAYFQDQVIKGNLTKFFINKTSEGFSPDCNVLEGSNKSEEEFEFSRGHQKLIISIAKLVKENLDKNGIDGFGSIKRYAETSKARQNQEQETSINKKLSDASFKLQKSSSVIVELDIGLSGANDEPALNHEYKEINADEIAIHQKKLIKQAVTSLRSETPEMFKKNFTIIQAAITSNLVTISRKKKGRGYTAKIKCPYCKDNITAFHIRSEANESGSWNSSNFGRHLVNMHSKTQKTKVTKKKAKKTIDDIMDADSDTDIAIKPDSSRASLPVGFVNDAKDIIPTTFGRATFRSIVDYSDTDGSDKDDEDCILIEVPSKVDPVMIESAIDEETFILMSNQPLELLEEISISYPDSLYKSDSSNGIEDDFADDKIEPICAEVVPVIRNGYKSTGIIPIYSVNTCAFDSVFAIYACEYFDNQHYREAFQLFVGQSPFSKLIKNFFEYVQSKAPVEKMHDLYRDRNNILNEIFSSNYYKNSDNIVKNRQYTFINCKTGIGGMFGQICIQLGENIASAIELKICSTCETTSGKILPFSTVDCSNVDLRDIQKAISPGVTQNRLCSTCKSRCTIRKILNDVLVLEVEPNTKIEYQKTISIQKLTASIAIPNVFEIFAVVEFDPKNDHFLSHVKRKNGEWKTYDDLKPSESDTDKTNEIYPFLLFYKQKTCSGYDHEFKTTLLSFFHDSKLRKPLVRKILPSDFRNTPEDTKHTSSKITIAERNKILEMGWKY